MTTTHPDPHTCPARGVELRTAEEIEAERQHYRMRAEKLGWIVLSPAELAGVVTEAMISMLNPGPELLAEAQRILAAAPASTA